MPILAGQIIRAADLAPDEWQPVDFTDSDGWSNYGNGYSDAQFRRHPLDGSVEIKGTVNGGSTANGSLLFRLPEGYFPASHVGFTIGDPVDGSICTLKVFSDGGGCRIYGGATGDVLSLDGIRFFSGWT